MNDIKSKPLVSIITPCYNGATYVHRLVESVLNQTYDNIELIFINDGSTDNTEEIVLSYKSKFEERGIGFTYVYQENAGQAAAVNKGLKIFKGEYLTWPDSDDWMTEDCIEKKVDFLEQHPEYGMVMCRIAVVDEGNPTETVATLYRKDVQTHSLFDDLITERDLYFAPIGYMVRSREFLDALPSRDIYEGRGGQNWQMLLPIAYKYDCGYMDQILGYYLTRDASHSRSEKTYSELLHKCDEHETILLNTLARMIVDEETRKRYISLVVDKYNRQRFQLAFTYQDKQLLIESYRKVYKGRKAPLTAKVKRIIGSNKLFTWTYKRIKNDKNRSNN